MVVTTFKGVTPLQAMKISILQAFTNLKNKAIQSLNTNQ
jgi:hypothetical protein